MTGPPEMNLQNFCSKHVSRILDVLWDNSHFQILGEHNLIVLAPSHVYVKGTLPIRVYVQYNERNVLLMQ